MNGKASKHTLTVDCPADKVGCVIGKQGKTIKCLQNLTGAHIDVDQTSTPTRISVSSADASDADFAMTLVRDIISGSFRVFNLEMLRDMPSADDEEEGTGAKTDEEDEEGEHTNADVRWGWTPWDASPWAQADIIRYSQGF